MENITINSAINRYHIYLAGIPARPNYWGKVKQYTKATLADIRGRLRRTVNQTGLKFHQPMSEITPELIAIYMDSLMESDVCASSKYWSGFYFRRWLQWCVERDYWRGDTDFTIPPYANSAFRQFPDMPKEKWLSIRKQPKNLKDQTWMALLFNQFRLNEIVNLRWENFPEGYFRQWKGATMEKVVRKGGYLWRVKLDQAGWAKMKNWWVKNGRPVEGWVFRGLNGHLTTGAIWLKFRQYKNRALYRPEDAKYRDMISPHTIRSFAARKFVKDFGPHVAALIGAQVGGWVPRSKHYELRYLDTRTTYVDIYEELIKKT